MKLFQQTLQTVLLILGLRQWTCVVSMNTTANPWLSTSTQEPIATTLTPYTSNGGDTQTTTHNGELTPAPTATTMTSSSTTASASTKAAGTTASPTKAALSTATPTENKNTIDVHNDLLVNFSLNFTIDDDADAAAVFDYENGNDNQTIDFIQTQVKASFAQTLSVNSKYIRVIVSNFGTYQYRKKLNLSNESLRAQSLDDDDYVICDGYLSEISAFIGAKDKQSAITYEATLEIDPDTPQDSKFVKLLTRKLSADTIDISVFFFDIISLSSGGKGDSSGKTTTIIVWFLGASAVCCMIAVIVMVCWRRVATEKAKDEGGINLEFLLDPNAPIDDSSFLKNNLDAPMKIRKKNRGKNKGRSMNNLNGGGSDDVLVYSDTIRASTVNDGRTPQGPSFQTIPGSKSGGKPIGNRLSDNDEEHLSSSKRNKAAYFDRLSDNDDDNHNHGSAPNVASDANDSNGNTGNQRNSMDDSYNDGGFSNVNNSMELQTSFKKGHAMSVGSDKNGGNNSEQNGKSDGKKKERRLSYTFEDDDSEDDDPYMMANSESDDLQQSHFGRLN